MRSSEIGYLGQIPEIDTSIDVRVFHDRIRSLLTHFRIPAADLNGKTNTVHNEGSMDIRGAETQVVYRPRPTTRFVLNYASMSAKATDFIWDAASQIDEHERSVPVFIGSMLAMHRFSSRWEASANYHRVSESKWSNNGDLVDGYSRVDVRLARDYRVGEYKGQLALTVQNTGPVTRTFRKENVFDRRTFVTLTLNR